MRVRTRRHGFTLVELLVVIAIIAVLIALLLPAIQAAREAARMTVCRSNMHQIGLALHAYHSANKKFPSGSTAPGGANSTSWGITDRGRNWLILLLPFLEEGTHFDSVDWMAFRTTQGGLTNFNTATGVAKFDAFTSKELSFLICPSDKYNYVKYGANRNPNSFGTPQYQWYGRTNYGANACLMPPFWYTGQWGLSGMNAQPCGGPTMAAWAFDSPYSFMSRGVMGMDASTSIKRITDGLSTTVAVWELRAGVHKGDFRGSWAHGFPAGSMVWMHLNGPNTCDQNPWAGDDIQGESSAVWAGINSNATIAKQVLNQMCMQIMSSASGPASGNPRSMHMGGMNGLFCDGSVRFISDFIERGTTQAGVYTDFQNLSAGFAEIRLLAWERINASADGLVVEESKLEP